MRDGVDNTRVRNVVLGLLLLQTTSIVLLMRYSNTRTTASGNARFLPSAAVLMAEVIKLPTCVAMAVRTAGGMHSFCAVVRTEIFHNWRDTLKCAVPALAYTAQGNLLFVALANLEVPTYQVAYQSKTVFTALFSRLILGRRLMNSQWLALFLLTAGTILVSDLRGAAKNGPTPSEVGGAPAESAGVGMAAVLSAAVLSASSSVYFEMMLKKKAASPTAAACSLWLRNIQLGIFALPLAAATMLAHDGPAVARGGVLQSFDGIAWAIVLLNGIGGLLVAATMKYADNIVKCFAAALAILSGTILSVPLFGFALSPAFAFGAACTVAASTLYAWAPDMDAVLDIARGRADATTAHAVDSDTDTDVDSAAETALLAHTDDRAVATQRRATPPADVAP